ncbi:protein involved in chromosome condensation, partial [Arthrobacter sp. Hiyo6]
MIQAGKGLGGSVNTFFRDQVLDAPATLSAADDVVEEFSNLMSIRQRLEDVRQQRDQLAPVPGLNKEYAQSLLDANLLRELAGEEFEAYRQQLAVTVHTKTLARIKDLAQQRPRNSVPNGRSGTGWPRNCASSRRTTTTRAATRSPRLSSRSRMPGWGSTCASRWRHQREALSDAGLELEWTAAG